MKLIQIILGFSLTVLAAGILMACGATEEPMQQPQQAASVVPTHPPAAPAQSAVVDSAVLPDLEEAGTPAEIEPATSTTYVEWVPNGPIVEGAESTLIRMEHGFYATFSAAELVPGDAYTLWWVIFNKPENCSDGECGLNDVFLFDANGERLFNDDGSPQWNFPAQAATEFALGRATGSVIDTDGTAEFRAHLPLEDNHEFGFGPGILLPFAAEVHLIIRTHGQMIPGLLHEQLNSAWGGCPEGWPKDPCKDVQISLHRPPE